MKKIKVGIIGIGGMGRGVHLSAFASNPNVEVVALCDIIKEKAEKAALEYNIDHVFENYKDLIAVDEIDAVSICTPNILHSTIAIEALMAGKHVFCEKPDAVDVDKVLKMKEASEKSHKMLMVMRNNRFMEISKYLKGYIDNGNLGNIYSAKCGWIRRRGIPGKGGWFTTKELSGGGPLIDLGVHMLDLTIWLMGNPTPVSVVGSTYCKFAQNDAKADSEHAGFGEAKEDGIFNVEDMATGYIKFDNGASLSLEFSWAENIEKEDRYFELKGTRMGAKWHAACDDQKLLLYGEDSGVTFDLCPNIENKEKQRNPHARNIDHFVDCLINNVEPCFKPQQGVNIVKVIEAIYKSAETGKEVLL